jgi:hypothetical protein
VVVCGTILICVVTWWLYGDKVRGRRHSAGATQVLTSFLLQNYSGPVRALTRWEAGAEIDLQSTLRTTNKSVSVRKQGSMMFASKMDPTDDVDPIVGTETATISPPVSDESVTRNASVAFRLSSERAAGVADNAAARS